MKNPVLNTLLLIVLWVGTGIPARAHVGSTDVYAEANAGTYKLFVVVRPPAVIPGVAQIEVRSQAPGIERIDITPMPLTGEGSTHPPVPDTMKRPSADKQYFTGALWIMAPGSWQVRFQLSGSQGTATTSVPVPAIAFATRKMTRGLGLMLGALGLFLFLGMVGIVGASVRDAQLPPGAPVPPSRRLRAGWAMGVTAIIMVAALWLGNSWWKAEAANYAAHVYKPLQMGAEFDGTDQLTLKVHDPGWFAQRKIDDFVLDHDHLMHLYMLREPGFDVVYHLHPEQVAPGVFQLKLPSMPGGDYRLYADVVHANGFPETMVSQLALPDIHGVSLSGDDAEGTATPISEVNPGGSSEFRLPDGYTMIWNRPAELKAKQPELFQFSLLDPARKPARDISLYMGMLGHAAFVKTDGTVFAHIHPSGSISMAALTMAESQNQPTGAARNTQGVSEMPGMEMSSQLPNEVSFPYGFPTPGRYRIFVQMKHGNTIETGAFDAQVN